MKRIHINLRKLPIWLQYLISLSVVGIVVMFAYLSSKDRSIPIWIEAYLIPILSWTFLILFISVIVDKIFPKSK